MIGECILVEDGYSTPIYLTIDIIYILLYIYYYLNYRFIIKFLYIYKYVLME